MNTNEGKIQMICPKCQKVRQMTRHHIFPKRFYGEKYGDRIFLLCRKCHDELEKLIPSYKMPNSFYPNVVLAFLKGGK